MSPRTTFGATISVPGRVKVFMMLLMIGWGQAACESSARTASSSAVRESSAARTESSMLCGREAPGMGMTTGASASSHASAICCGLTPRASASSWNAECCRPMSPARRMPPSGDHGRKAMPSAAQWSSSGRLERNAGENWFCTDDEPAVEDRVRLVDLGDVRIRDPRHLDHAVVEQVADGADRVGVRNLRVRPVELVQPDRLDAEAARRGLRGLLQVLGTSVQRP